MVHSPSSGSVATFRSADSSGVPISYRGAEPVLPSSFHFARTACVNAFQTKQCASNWANCSSVNPFG
jgi:hypothetical protein